MKFDEQIKDAIINLKELNLDYYNKCLEQRLINGKGSTTDYTNIADMEDALLSAHWKPYKHENIAPNCIGAITYDISGYIGVIDLLTLDPNKDCILIDPKGTGTLSLATKISTKDCRVNYTIAIIGEENNIKVMYTFHPGEPLKPSVLKSDGNNEYGLKEGDHLTVAEAIKFGFKHVKAM